jgi:hypothetical protein
MRRHDGPFSDLECLFHAVKFAKYFGTERVLKAALPNVRRAVAIVDASLVRSLREWSLLKQHGLGDLVVEQGRIAKRIAPRIGRTTRAWYQQEHDDTPL